MGSADRQLSHRRRRALAAYDAWQAAAGPWARWSIWLPLLGPGLDELCVTLSRPRQPSPAGHQLVEQLAAELGSEGAGPSGAAGHSPPGPGDLAHSPSGHPQGEPAQVGAACCLVVLDLVPDLGLRVAAGLARRGLAQPLALIGRWPYAQAVLPARKLVETAIAESHDLGAPAGRHLVLVLDAERTRSLPARPASDARADNRYELLADDFPDPTSLIHAGIQRVLDVRARGAAVPPLLARRVYPTWAAAGLAVHSP